MKDSIRRKVSENIKQLRKKYKYKQEKLSEVTVIDYKYHKKIEGKNPPAMRIDTIARFAKALKVTPDKLLK